MNFSLCIWHTFEGVNLIWWFKFISPYFAWQQSFNTGIYLLFLAILEIPNFCLGEINGTICSSQQYNLSPSLSLFLDYFQKLDMNLKLLWNEKFTLLTLSPFIEILPARELKSDSDLPQMLKSRTLRREFQRFFLIYKTEQRSHWVSSNFGVFLFICSVPGFVT